MRFISGIKRFTADFQEKPVLNLFKFGLAKPVGFTRFHRFTDGKPLPVGSGFFLSQNGLVILVMYSCTSCMQHRPPFNAIATPPSLLRRSLSMSDAH